MEDYKIDIEQTRTGNVGSSDSKMLQQIAELGKVPQSAMKRMAVIKGLRENDNITNAAMRFGDYAENAIFANLKATDERWQSNPCLISMTYSRPNCGVLDHIDYMLQDDDNKVLTLGEAKATKLSFAQARDEYHWQLCHHWILGSELAQALGGYKLRLLFCVYDTNDIDYETHEFDSQRLTVKQLRNMDKLSKSYRLADAMDIVDSFLETFDSYYEEEISGEYLPEKVRNEFDTITTFLAEIKEREQKVDAFKKKLTEFMIEKGIKSVKTDDWNITLVEASESVQFDSKAFLSDYQVKHPYKAQKLLKTFEKRVKKNPYCKITIKNNNN